MNNLTAWVNTNKTKAMIFGNDENGEQKMFLGKITTKQYRLIEQKIDNANIIYQVGDTYFNGLYKTFKTPKVALSEILN